MVGASRGFSRLPSTPSTVAPRMARPPLAWYAPSAPWSHECPPLHMRPESPCRIVIRSRNSSTGRSEGGRVHPASGVFEKRSRSCRGMNGISTGWSCLGGRPLPSSTKRNRNGASRPSAPRTMRSSTGASTGALAPRVRFFKKRRRLRVGSFMAALFLRVPGGAHAQQERIGGKQGCN